MSIKELFLGMVEYVTHLAIDSDGVATSKGDDDHQLESQTGWHFGFYSRPNDGAIGVVLKAGGQGNNSLVICYRDKQYEMTLERGEVGIQNAFSASILLNKNGEIVLNGGTKKVARVDDTAKASATLATWMGQVEGFINGASPGTVSPLSGTFSGTSVAVINSGAAKVLG